MKRKFYHLVILIFLFCIFSGAHAGIFGPSNYEECVLSKLKGTEGEAATYAIQQACYMKFPDQSEAKTSKNENQVKKDLRTRCGLSAEQDKSGNLFLAGQTRPRVTALIGNFKNIKMEYGAAPKISFQNKSAGGISGVMVGMGIKGKWCSANTADYDAVFYCAEYFAGGGVPPSGYGSIPCQNEINKFREKSYCVIGVRPRFDALTEGLSSGMSRLGLCD